MYLVNFYDGSQLEQIHSHLKKLDWQDGKDTARGSAKDIKNNFQITAAQKAAAPLLRGVVKSINENKVVSGYTYLRKVISPRFAKYGPGNAYGWHVDFAYMEQERTDFSFTIWLNDPSEYEGGELALDFGERGKKQVKGKAGQMIIYPTGVLHEVTEVLSGERQVIVGWINSYIAEQATRDTLRKMNQATLQLTQMLRESENTDPKALEYCNSINECYFNFLRAFIK